MGDRNTKSQSSLKRAIDVLILLSVVSGLVLLPQLYVMVPKWLFYSVLTGWLTYVLAAAAVVAGRQVAYLFVFFLAIFTLSVSLPQPEHYAFLGSGLALAAATFLIGSGLQLSLVVLIPIYLVRRRKKS